MKLNEITQAVIGAAMKVHSALGPGILESAYEACLGFELTNQGFDVIRQRAVPLVYGDVKLDCGFRADIIVNNCIVVEVKAKESIHPVDAAQTLSHLRLLDMRVGLLINFHEISLKQGIRRIVNNYQG